MRFKFLFALGFVAMCLATQAQTSPQDAVRFASLRSLAQAASDKGDNPEIVRLDAEAIKIYGQDGDVWNEYAGALAAQKMYPEAIAAYKNVLRYGAFEPKFSAEVAYNLSCIAALQGDKPLAFKQLKDALGLGFRDLQHVREDKDLESLHSDPQWVDIAATKDVSKMSRDEGWRYDLWLLDREVRRIHITPYRVTPKKSIDDYVRKLNADIPKLTDEQVAVAFVRYMVFFGDGHTGIRVPEGPMTQSVPAQFYQFAEGTYCLAAGPKNPEIVGLKLTKVNGQSLDAVWPSLSAIVRHDNEMGIVFGVPQLLSRPSILYGLGLSKDNEVVTYTFVDQGGKESTVTLRREANPDVSQWVIANAHAGDPEPLSWKNRAKPYWFEYLPDSKILYFQYNAVRNDPAESVDKFAERMFKDIDEHEVNAMVVDTRWNGGGNTFLSAPLINGIVQRARLNQKGHLFVITGRQTFSACQNFVTDLERLVHPVFVGEPTGSCPNFTGESIPFKLPYSKMSGTISDLYWQRSWPMDHRMWIAPDLPAPPSIEAFKMNQDPAMEAIMAYLATK